MLPLGIGGTTWKKRMRQHETNETPLFLYHDNKGKLPKLPNTNNYLGINHVKATTIRTVTSFHAGV